jgi:hypothetical protein
MRNFAKRLSVCEVNGNKSAKIKGPDDFSVCKMLRSQLATLMGNGGYRALLSRFLALASAGVPWLRMVHMKSDGALGGLGALPAQLGLDKFF